MEHDVSICLLHGRILTAAAQGSAAACEIIYRAYLPPLIASFITIAITVEQRRAYLSNVIDLLRGAGSLGPDAIRRSAGLYKVELVDLFGQGIGMASYSPLRIGGIMGLEELVKCSISSLPETVAIARQLVGAMLEDPEEHV